MDNAVQTLLFQQLACFALALIGVGAWASQRVFPAGNQASTSALSLFNISCVAALVAPAGGVVKLAGAAGMLAIVLIGRWRDLRSRSVGACNCFGSLSPKSPWFYAGLLVVSLASFAVIAVAAWRSDTWPRSWLLPAATAFAGLVIYLALRMLKYSKIFYSHEATGDVPTAIDGSVTLGWSASGETRSVEEVRGDSAVLMVVVLSSSCPSCYDLLTQLGESLDSAKEARIEVAFVSDHMRMYRHEEREIVAFVDKQLAIARLMQATKLPVAFAIKANGMLLAPPSRGNAAIVALLRVLRRAQVD